MLQCLENLIQPLRTLIQTTQLLLLVYIDKFGRKIQFIIRLHKKTITMISCLQLLMHKVVSFLFILLGNVENLCFL